MKDLLEKYKMFQTPKLANEISWKDMKEFNSYMKEVVRDYKIKQAKSIQSARNVIISWQGKNPFGVEASPCGIIKTFSDTIVNELREQYGCGLMLPEHDSNKKTYLVMLGYGILTVEIYELCHQLKRKSQTWAVSSNGQSAGFAHRKIGFESRYQ